MATASGGDDALAELARSEARLQAAIAGADGSIQEWGSELAQSEARLQMVLSEANGGASHDVDRGSRQVLSATAAVKNPAVAAASGGKAATASTAPETGAAIPELIPAGGGEAATARVSTSSRGGTASLVPETAAAIPEPTLAGGGASRGLAASIGGSPLAFCLSEQQKYVQDLLMNERRSTEVIGPAGSGKTLTICQAAIQWLEQSEHSKVLRDP